jgi:RNA polymerase sigma-70 factor (ECF subfamily)
VTPRDGVADWGVDRGAEAREAAEAAARRSYGRLVAYLASRTRDVAAAEDALSEAFATALADWPKRGVPDNPEAWLLTAARRKAIDALRRRQQAEAGAIHLRLIAEELEAAAMDANTHPGEIPDRRLALMFACAHPAIDAAIRAPLILQCVLGFDAATIASAFLTSPATMGQRLVRAKSKIRDSGIPFRVPERSDLGERLSSVLDAIYAVFAEGWTDPAGADPRRRDLAGEAIWLGRLVAALLPDQPEALGLLSLMLHAEARRGARRDAAGEFVPLADQDAARWDPAMIAEAEDLLRRANAMDALGRFQLEAAVQSAHAIRRLTGGPDWSAIVRLYDGLIALTGSPVAEINRAVALAEVEGAAAGIAALDAVAADPRIAEYQPYWAARAALLARAGDSASADRAYELAIGLESDPALRRFLQQRRAAAAGS